MVKASVAAKGTKPTPARCCAECGVGLPPAKPNAPHQRFCGAACRKRFNNRRATRGAELFDYYMSMRYQRATHGGNIAVMNQMALAWRDEDRAEREGRQSWMTPDLSGDPNALTRT